MTANAQFLAEVEAFLTLSGMSASTFGHRTRNDGKFVDRLRNGGGVSLEGAQQVRAFMSAWRQQAGGESVPASGRVSA